MPRWEGGRVDNITSNNFQYMNNEKGTRQIRVDKTIHKSLKMFSAEHGISICDIATTALADFFTNTDYAFNRAEVQGYRAEISIP